MSKLDLDKLEVAELYYRKGFKDGLYMARILAKEKSNNEQAETRL